MRKAMELTETYEFDRDSRIDKENRIIHSACLCRRIGQDGKRIWEPGALATIAEMSEGIRSFSKHSDKEPGERDPEDLVGHFYNTVATDRKVTGEFTYLESRAKLMESLVSGEIPKVGFSVTAVGGVEVRKGVQHVIDVTRLKSCDLVSNTGSTVSLFESGKGEAMDKKAPYSDYLEAVTEGKVIEKPEKQELTEAEVEAERTEKENIDEYERAVID